ncbi:neuronal acetylcholine receptor subunit alpha-3-like [Pomacea canaliculata]|uniref:neuronal acetylcholine receptor subunit alpha-3-like n=1 Tax=Pomacea canaliculata TaxID=400727 RepID=UPI000D72B723|nr:neuronal acetylcholine receptor subunit alpha-3-like [Pomacea canaliculata]
MDVLTVQTFIAAVCHLFLAEGTLAPLTDPVRNSYGSLMENLLAHPAVQFKIPPSPPVTTSFNSSYPKHKTVVEIELLPTNILEVNGNQEIMVMSAFLILRWGDPHLTWNASDYEGVVAAELKASQIWTPFLTVIEEVEEKKIALDDSITLTINQTGRITVSLEKLFKTYCKLNFSQFPFDEQKCSITFLSASLTSVKLKYISELSGSFMREYSQGGEWNITDMYWEIKPSSSVSYQPSILKAVFVLSRQKYFYTITLIAPMFISAFMNCLVFAIPLQAGEKVSFLISIFLSNTVFSGYLSDIMPHTFQSSVPLLMVLLLGLWIWSVLTFLATIFVLYRYHQEQEQIIEDNGECKEKDKEEITPVNCLIDFFTNIFNKRNKVSDHIRPILVNNSPQSEIPNDIRSFLQTRSTVKDLKQTSPETDHKSTFENSNYEAITSVMSQHDTSDKGLSMKHSKYCTKLQTNLSMHRKKSNKLNAKTLDQIFLCVSLAVLSCITTIFFLQITGTQSLF